MADPERVIRSYYRAIDAGEFDRLRGLLAPSFTQKRPDRTFGDRDTFLEFMREDRPNTETTHAVEAIYEDDQGGFAVRGRLLSDGEELVAFVDVFALETGKIRSIRTFTG